MALGESYPSAETQSVYSSALVDWAKTAFDGKASALLFCVTFLLPLLSSTLVRLVRVPSLGHFDLSVVVPVRAPSMGHIDLGVVVPVMVPSMGYIDLGVIVPVGVPSMGPIDLGVVIPVRLPSMGHFHLSVVTLVRVPSMGHIDLVMVIPVRVPSMGHIDQFITMSTCLKLLKLDLFYLLELKTIIVKLTLAEPI